MGKRSKTGNSNFGRTAHNSKGRPHPMRGGFRL